MAAKEWNILKRAEATDPIPIGFFLRDMIFSRKNNALFFLRGKIATFELVTQLVTLS